MNMFKLSAIITIFGISSTINAADFTYHIQVQNGKLEEIKFEYKNVTFSLKQKQYLNPTLSLDSLLYATLKSNNTILAQQQFGIDIFEYKNTLWPFFHSRGVYMESYENKRSITSGNFKEFDKIMYNWGLHILKDKFNVTITPQQPWYKRYWAYILGTLGICAAGYCYLKYAQQAK